MIRKLSTAVTAALALALTSLGSLPAVAQVVLNTLSPPYTPLIAAGDPTNHMVYMLSPPFNAGVVRNPHSLFSPPPSKAQQGAVVILDSKSGAFTSIPGLNPKVIAVDATANKIYVGNASYPAANGFAAVPSSLTIINGADNSYTSLAMSSPNAIVVDPVANKVYVAVADSNNDLLVVDGKSNTISATIPMPALLDGLAVDTGLGKIYGYNLTASNLLSVNLATSAITSIPTGGSYVTALVVDSQTHRAYAVDYEQAIDASGRGILVAINTNNDRRVATRYVGIQPTAAALNPNTKTVYVVNTFDPAFPLDPNQPAFIGPSMTVLDEATLRPHAVPLVGESRILGINPVTNKIYVPSDETLPQNLTVVDGNTNLPAAAYAASEALDIALDPGLNQAYLLTVTGISSTVTVLDLTGGSVAVPTIFPSSLKFSSPAGQLSPPQTVYLANIGGMPMDVAKLTYNRGFLRQTHDCPAVLDPGAVCPIRLRFRASSANPTYVTDTFQAAISTGATAATSIVADVPPLLTSMVLSGSNYYNGLLYVNASFTSADPELSGGGLTVTATLNGVTSSSVIDDGQIAISFDPSVLVPGKAYPVTLSFAGNALYLPSTVTGTVTP